MIYITQLYRRSLSLYLLLSTISIVLLPFVAISRIQGESGAAQFSLALRVLMSACFLVGALSSNYLRPKSFFQLSLLLIFIVSLLLGLLNFGLAGNERPFFVHSFNLIFAYLAYSFGRGGSLASISMRFFLFYRKLAVPVLFVSAVVTAASFSIFAAGDSLGRFYSPIYQIGLPAAVFTSSYNITVLVASAMVALASNKRGSLLMVLSIVLVGLLVRPWSPSRKQTKSKSNYKRFLVPLGIALISALFIIYFRILSEAAILAMNRIPFLGSESIDLSGRDIEVELAMANINGIEDLFFGGGIGWSLNLPGREMPVNSIHFSPLTLLIVYGPWSVVALYIGLLYTAICSLFSSVCRRGKISFEETLFASSYIIGSLAYSFTAYNLFIDPNIFIFAGILSSSINVSQVSKISSP